MFLARSILDKVVGIATRLPDQRSGVRVPTCSGIFHLSKSSKPALGVKRSFVMLTIRLHLAPRLGMSGVIPPLPLCAFMVWNGTNLSFFFPKANCPAIVLTLTQRQ